MKKMITLINSHIAKFRTEEDLLSDYSNIPTEEIEFIENKYGVKLTNALKSTSRLDVLLENTLKIIFLVYFIYQSIVAVNYFLDSFNFIQVLFGLLLGSFLIFSAILIFILCYFLSFVLLSFAIKFIFLNSEYKLIENVKELKNHKKEDLVNQERHTRVKKAYELQVAQDSVMADIEKIRSHFINDNHAPLISSKKLENKVETIFKTLLDITNYEFTRKDQSSERKFKEVKNYRTFLWLLAHVEDDEDLVSKISHYHQLSNLLNNSDQESEFGKSLLKELMDLSLSDNKIITYNIECSTRHKSFLDTFDSMFKLSSI